MASMLGCRSANAFMKTNVNLLPGQEKILDDPGRYQMLVDKLNYLTVTTSYCICCECCEIVSLSTEDHSLRCSSTDSHMLKEGSEQKASIFGL